MPPSLTITRSTPDSPAAIPLIDALSAELLRRFGRDGRNSFADWNPEAACILIWLLAPPNALYLAKLMMHIKVLISIFYVNVQN
jgi:hypothetical protein